MGTFLIILGVVFFIYFLVKANKANEEQKNKISDYDKRISDSYETEKPVNSASDKIKKLTDEMINIGVDGLVSLVMTENEKEDIVAKTIESFRTDFPTAQLQTNMYHLASKSYQKQIASYTENKELNDEIKKRYRKFLSLPDKSNFEMYGYEDLLDFSERYKRILGGSDAREEAVAYDRNDENDLYIKITGTKYITSQDLKAVKELKIGDKLKFVSEPENEYDPNAIAIYTLNNARVGYVPKDLTVYINDIELKEHTLTVARITEHNIPYVNAKYLKII